MRSTGRWHVKTPSLVEIMIDPYRREPRSRASVPTIAPKILKRNEQRQRSPIATGGRSRI
ncbi:hypothetical protein NXC24_PC00462 (plasmid) [Rhizobium sp. NXC24]|nr:hypothetical protein NXC24_PC00462 [Rhizobium sp. NXC24]